MSDRHTLAVLQRDDDAQQDFGFTSGACGSGRRRTRPPNTHERHRARCSGGTPTRTRTATPTVLGDDGGVQRAHGSRDVPHFHHAYVFEFNGTRYHDGGETVIQRLVNGTWTTLTGCRGSTG